MISLKKSLKELFNLPAEIILDYPLLMLVGDKELFMENHKGLALYQKDKIIIRTKIGQLEIRGSNLNIEKIDASVILINGEIGDLAYEE